MTYFEYVLDIIQINKLLKSNIISTFLTVLTLVIESAWFCL